VVAGVRDAGDYAVVLLLLVLAAARARARQRAGVLSERGSGACRGGSVTDVWPPRGCSGLWPGWPLHHGQGCHQSLMN
jgi:hypothetical protein